MEKNFSPLEREIYNLTGLETKREYRFHPTREWRFDFAIRQLMWPSKWKAVFGTAGVISVRKVICGIWKSITRQPLAAGLLYAPFRPNYCG